MAEDNKNLPVISKQTLQRLPYYLHYLKSSTEKGRENISARLIADELRLNEIQVRKDLASVSKSGGKPKTGFLIKSLIEDIEEFLGYNNIDGVVLVGAGQLGRTLLSYRGFDNYGINIEAAFDVDETLIGLKFHDKMVFPMEKLPDYCQRRHIRIGIITVPTENAQKVCDILVQSGILAIWNFAPTHLQVDENILVQNENMAASLAMLSRHLTEKQNDK